MMRDQEGWSGYPMSAPRIVSGFAVAAALLVLSATEPASAAATRGQILSQQWCAQCHGVRTDQPSANPDVPSFSAIAAEPSATEYSLRIFLRVPHPTMPNFVLKPDDIDDLVDYIISLRPQKDAPPTRPQH